MKISGTLWRWSFYFISILLAFLALYTLAVFARSDAGTNQNSWLSIIWALIGISWASTGVISNVINIKASTGIQTINKKRLIGELLPNTTAFVDRGFDSVKLVEAIKDNQVVNLHGRKGSGKSHFLAYVSDIANSHKVAKNDHQILSDLSAFSVVYFDLSESLGFSDVVTKLFSTYMPKSPASWDNFVEAIDSAFRKEPVILILDNINASALWHPLGTAVFRYLGRRTNDKIVLGSIIPVRFNNLPVYFQRFEGFNRNAIVDFAVQTGLSLDNKTISKIETESDGLPLYLNLLFTHWDKELDSHGGISKGLRELIKHSVIPRLSQDGLELLVGISLLSVVTPEVALSSLNRLPVARIEDRLNELVDFSMLTKRPRKDLHFIKLHDLVRDSVLEICDDAVKPIARLLATDTRNRGLENESAIYWMFSDVENTEDRNSIELLMIFTLLFIITLKKKLNY